MASSPFALSRERLAEVLGAVLDSALPAGAGREYRLVGTAAALLQGVELPARDVDILVRERGAVDAFVAALSAFPCLAAPTWLPGSRQYYAALAVQGVEVEFSTVEWPCASDTVECLGEGPWRHHVRVPCGRHQVTAVALELRLLTELSRGRPDRYEPILGHLSMVGTDVALLRRGLEDARIADPLRRLVLARLAGAGGSE